MEYEVWKMMREIDSKHEAPISPLAKRVADKVVKDAGAFGFGAAALFAGAIAAVAILEEESA